jgi:DNA processing protein
VLGVSLAGPLGPRPSAGGGVASFEAADPDDGRPYDVRDGTRARRPPVPADAATHAGGHVERRWIEAERRAWTILASVDGVGPRTFARLLSTHGSAREVLRLARAGRLGRGLAIDPAGPASAARLLPTPVLASIFVASGDPDAFVADLGHRGIWTVTLLDPDYPARLRRIVDPPPVLYGAGDPASLHGGTAVAIVGTRHPTARGRFVASRAGATLASAGAIVISGLAVGIDGAAHAGAVAAGRPTVAVIGSGHATPGPVPHRALVGRILATGGSVVGELRPDARATRGTYPRRNRIIAGLADAVLVVEAPQRSGALITAGLALENGIPLFAVPGREGSAASAGCRALLGETEAVPFESVQALLEAIRERDGAIRTTWPGRSGDIGPVDAPVTSVDLGVEESRVAAIVAEGPVTGDRVVERTGLAPGVAAGVLTLLQIRGLVTTLGPPYLPAGRLLVGQP